MEALTEIYLPSLRATALAAALSIAGINTGVCTAMDNIHKPAEGIPHYELTVHIPVGLLSFVVRRTFPIAQKTGIFSQKAVRNIGKVLFLTGNLYYLYKSFEGLLVIVSISYRLDDGFP